jgi:hypothetical protein
MTWRITAAQRVAVMATVLLAVTMAGGCGAGTAPSSPPRPSSTPHSVTTGSAPGSPTALLSPQPAALGAPGDFWGDEALSQPAGRAALAYLQARAAAAVSPKALVAFPAFFVPYSPDIARETYLARGRHAQWVDNGWPPATTVDSLEPSSVSLTVQNRDASFAGHATDVTSFASGRSDQEGEVLDHTIELRWMGGRWLVHEDAYVSDVAPGQLAKGGAPRQMVAAAVAEVESTLGQADPAQIAAATGVVRAFGRLVDQGRYLAAQRLVRPGSHVSAPELGREVAHLKLLRADVTGVPGNAAIELQTTLRVTPRSGGIWSFWSSGATTVYFTVTRESIGRPWLIDEYGSAP